MNDEARIYRYIVRYDGGTAPNPYAGYCTLAICKPRIRRTARVGDWVIGFRSRHRGEVLYAMEVGESLSFASYWNDPRFRSRRPDVADVPTDNIYRPIHAGSDECEWVANKVHDHPDAAKKDLSGQRVLVARRFWYFGQNSQAIHPELQHLAPVTQGHVVRAHKKPGDLERLIDWLSRFPTGRQGEPIDRKT